MLVGQKEWNAKRVKDDGGRIHINLRGQEGNAFALMGQVTNLGRELDLDKAEIRAILADMRSSDYEHLLSVMEKHFGDYVLMYR